MQSIQRKGGRSDDEETQGETLRVLYYDSTSWVAYSFVPAILVFNKNNKENGVKIQIDFISERLGPHKRNLCGRL